MKPNLKLICTDIVMESTLNSLSKIQLLKYIRYEANEVQLKAFLLDGKIVKLDEQAMEIVNERFEISEYPELLEGSELRTIRKSLATRVGTLVYLGVPWAIYRKIRSVYDGCTKKCGTLELNTKRRQYCMAKCKVEKLKKELASSKDPKGKQELKNKLDKAILVVRDYDETAKKSGVTLNP